MPAVFPRTGYAGNRVSEKASSRQLGEYRSLPAQSGMARDYKTEASHLLAASGAFVLVKNDAFAGCAAGTLTITVSLQREGASEERRIQIRVLVAFEDEYRVYGAAITGAVRRARPTDEIVVSAEIRALERQVRSFAPHLIISSLPAPTNYSGEWFSWVRLSPGPNRPSEICVEGKRRESLNPSLGELLCVFEETEGLLVGSNQGPRGAR